MTKIRQPVLNSAKRAIGVVHGVERAAPNLANVFTSAAPTAADVVLIADMVCYRPISSARSSLASTPACCAGSSLCGATRRCVGETAELRFAARIGGACSGAFAELTTCKYYVNAAYAGAMLNAGIVNAESMRRKLAYFRQKLLKKGRFPSSKTTVKYDLRFFVNGETVHFAARSFPASG